MRIFPGAGGSNIRSKYFSGSVRHLFKLSNTTIVGVALLVIILMGVNYLLVWPPWGWCCRQPHSHKRRNRNG